MGVKGRDDVSEWLRTKRGGVFKRMLRHIPARAIQLTQPRENILHTGIN